MSDYTHTSIGSGYNTTSAINTELTAVETAVATKLDSDGGFLTTLLDANSNKLINLPDAASNGEPVTLRQYTADAGSIGTTTAPLVTYTAPGTGAVASTVQAKLTESVSVLDFGAIGNGVADDTVAIQAALDSITSGTVIIPSGTYKISSALTATSVSVSIDCLGTLAETVAIDGAILFTSCTNFEIKGVTYTGAETSGSFTASDSKEVIKLVSCDNFVVERTTATAKTSLIRTESCTNGSIRNNKHTGVFSTQPTNSPVASASYDISGGSKINVEGNTASQSGDGVLVGQDADTVLISNNRIFDNYDDGIYISSGTNCKIAGNLVKNCSHTSNSPSGIKPRGTGHSVIGNSILSCRVGITVTGNGITVDGFTDSNSVSYFNGSGNIVEGNYVYGCERYGIVTQNQDVDGSGNNLYPRHCVFNSNTVIDCGNGGFYPILIFGGTGHTCSNNIVQGSYRNIDVGATEITGSVVIAGATTSPNAFNSLDCKCDGNNINSPATTAHLQLINTDRYSVNNNNIVSATASNVIRMTTSDDGLMSGNVMKGNGSETSINEQSGCAGNYFSKNYGRVAAFEQTVSIAQDNYMTGGSMIYTTVANTPLQVGLIAITGGNAYISKGVASSADWVQVNN